MRHSKIASFLIATSFTVLSVHDSLAADAYVIRFHGGGKSDGVCTRAMWGDTVLLFNRSTVPAEVRIVGLSNGTASNMTPDAVVVPPGQVVSLDQALNGAWEPPTPNPDYNLWTLHLAIPAGVTVESRDEVYLENFCILPVQPTSLGKASMPVFRALTPPNVAQVFLGTDLGARSGRTNVVIYNAGTTVAAAHIELRRACDNVVVDQMTVAVPSNTTIQIGGLGTVGGACQTFNTPEWMLYTVVTVDQPSLSFVSNVTEGQATEFDTIVPQIDLGVARNTEF